MKRRSIVFLLIISLLSSFVSVSANETTTLSERVVAELLEQSPEGRQNLYYFFKPMLTKDSGIDMLIGFIEKNESDSAGMIDGYIREMLRYTDKETMIASLEKFRIIPEEIRIKYGDALYDRMALSLSAEEAQLVEGWMQKAFQKYEGLEKLCTEDGFTAEVLAHQMLALAEINDGEAILTDGANGGFALYSLSDTFVKLMDGVVSPEEILASLNSLSAEKKQEIKLLGDTFGFYRKNVAYRSPMTDGTTGNREVDETQQLRYEKKGSHIDGGDLLEVALYIGEEKQPYGALAEDITISVMVEEKDIAVYRLEEGEEILHPYFFCEEGVLYLRVSRTGEYLVRCVEKYFYDAIGWGADYIEGLYHRGIINGKAERRFMPEDSITREEFVKLVVELFDYTAEGESGFADVDENAWYAPYVAAAKENGVINGIGDGLFGVGQPITRQDIAKLLWQVVCDVIEDPNPEGEGRTFADRNEIADYAAESVTAMTKLGVISGDSDGYFHPEDHATRQEAAKMVYLILREYVGDCL